MWSFVDDCPGLPVDVVLANLDAWNAPFADGPSGEDRAVHLLTPNRPSAVTMSVGSGPGTITGPNLGERFPGPVRITAQQWDIRAVNLVRSWEQVGLHIDTSTLPRVAPSAIAYWDTKLGGLELLQDIPGVRELVPASTLVSSLAEAASLTASLRAPAVLKVNRGIGGAGVVALDPETTARTPRALNDAIMASVNNGEGKKKAPKSGLVDLGGPYLLQQRVGGDAPVSPTVDLWIEEGHSACIGLAEQLLHGFSYAGATFPGRLTVAISQQCVTVATEIAEVLRSRGYRGLLNVDFVTDGDRIWVIELNVRQSTPLDQSIQATRAYGAGWRDRGQGFSYREHDGRLELTG